jgi:hypothetical protein
MQDSQATAPPKASAGVPAVVATGILCLAVGAGLGVLGMTFFGYQVTPVAAAGGSQSSASTGAAPGGMPGMPGGGPGMGGMGGMGGFKGPSPKIQLASLVGKLGLLAEKPLTVSLNEDQKKKVREQLAGLDAKNELPDEDAKKRLDTLLDVLKDQKETLESAGYRWPGQKGFQRPPDDPNPFKAEKNAKALKSLQTWLGEAPAGAGGKTK